MRQTRILMRFFSIRFEWRSVPSRCFWLQFAQLGSHLETWKSFLRASLGCDARDQGPFFGALVSVTGAGGDGVAGSCTPR